MPGSLLDFGQMTQQAVQLAQNQTRNNIALANLDLDRQRQEQYAQQIDINRQQQQTGHLNAMREIWQDPRVQSNDSLSDQMFAAMAPSLGIPTEHLIDNLTQSRKDRQDLLTATLNGDEKTASASAIKLVGSLPPDKQAVALKNLEAIPTLRAKLQAAQQVMEINGAKYDKMRQDQAIINDGLGPITAASALLRQHTKGIDSPSFKLAQKIYKDTNYSGILTSKDQTISDKGKADFSFLLDGKGEALANGLDEELKQYEYQLSTAQNAIIDLDHGVKHPGNARQELTARIATLSPIIGAMREMQEWYRDPLDSEKATRAKLAYQGIEQRRLELESMNKKVAAQRDNLVNLANEKFDYKQSQDSAIAKGQQRLAEMGLTDPVKISKAAAQIAAQIEREDGVLPKVDDIMQGVKNPNAPQSQTTVNLERGLSNKVAERIDKGANVAQDAVQKIGVINRMMDAVSDGNVNVGPGATVQQYMSQLASKFGGAGKTVDERLANTRVVIQGLAQLVLSNRGAMEGQGQISNYESQLAERAATPGEIEKFTIPELKALLAISDKAARFEYGLHESRMKVLRQEKNENVRNEAKYFEAPPLPPSRFSEDGSEIKKAQPKAQPQSGATLKSLPQGSKQIGTSNGKPVYQSPDGKKWIGN